MLSFGDAAPFVSRIREAGALLMVQVHDEERAAFADAQERGDTDAGLVWAGEGVELVREAAPAAEVVRRIVHDAERRLDAIARLSTGVDPQPPAPS
jgi:NAD(P)H-dependent flavin oxidoreductase YrpB (nitropropane dioxygenase family)